MALVVYLSFRQFTTVQGNRPEAWGQCERSVECVKVDEFCGAFSAINRKFIEAHDKSLDNKVGGCTGREDFSAQKTMRADCVGGRCVLAP